MVCVCVHAEELVRYGCPTSNHYLYHQWGSVNILTTKNETAHVLDIYEREKDGAGMVTVQWYADYDYLPKKVRKKAKLKML